MIFVYEDEDSDRGPRIEGFEGSFFFKYEICTVRVKKILVGSFLLFFIYTVHIYLEDIENHLKMVY